MTSEDSTPVAPDTPPEDTPDTPPEGTSDMPPPPEPPAADPPAAEPPAAPPPGARSRRPPLPWPPPGLEKIQGKLWRVIGTLWLGSLVLVLPLLWSLGIEQPFSSLGPFEANWELGLFIALLGLAILLLAFAGFFNLMRQSGRAADEGYGNLTIAEVASDLSRDMGFLLQGKRYFSEFDSGQRGRLVIARLRGGGLILIAGLWVSFGFALSVLFAARGFLTPSGTWLLTFGPAVVLLVLGLLLYWYQIARIYGPKKRWGAGTGEVDKVGMEAAEWNYVLRAAGDMVALGPGAAVRGGSFRAGAAVVVLLFLLIIVPTATIAVTSTLGPVLAEIAVPTFLSVQEMAGAAEVLRRYRLDSDAAVTAEAAGLALHDLSFVGSDPVPEVQERPPVTTHPDHWFPNPDVFPDMFQEQVAYDLMAIPLNRRSQDERDALRQAAAHLAHNQIEVVARAPGADIVRTRWFTPFPETMTIWSLPWARFTAFRYAALAHISRAAVEVSQGSPAAAEETIREVISTGFLLIDEGPTLIDNLMGVVIANMGGDALEGLYASTGRAAESRQLRWARESAESAARISRVGLAGQDIHALLLGIPNLVENEDALRGLRWEYLATFNMLAPCINLHKMVFGADVSYLEWINRSRNSLVRYPGEAALFDIAGSGGVARAATAEQGGFLAQLVSLTMGGQARPGDCARLIGVIEEGGVF